MFPYVHFLGNNLWCVKGQAFNLGDWLLHESVRAGMVAPSGGDFKHPTSYSCGSFSVFDWESEIGGRHGKVRKLGTCGVCVTADSPSRTYIDASLLEAMVLSLKSVMGFCWRSWAKSWCLLFHEI